MTTKFFSATVLMLLSAGAFGDIKLKKMVGMSLALLDPH
jgi:hypothetical protein